MKKQKRVYPVPKGCVTISDVAKTLGVCDQTVRRWVHNGYIEPEPHKSTTRRFVFDESKLQRDLQKFGVDYKTNRVL